MGRLFDGNKAATDAAAARSRQEEVRQRADEVEELLRSYQETDEASRQMAAMMSEGSVTSITYHTHRQMGSKWVIEHAQDGPDYIYQVFPLRPPAIDWVDVVTLMAGAMDVIFPKSVILEYRPPNEQYNIKAYTIRVREVTGLPGWKKACMEQALSNLSGVEAW